MLYLVTSLTLDKFKQKNLLGIIVQRSCLDHLLEVVRTDDNAVCGTNTPAHKFPCECQLVPPMRSEIDDIVFL
jgi:hypothetical protein